MPKLTLNRLCELVEMDRRAVAPLLDTVPYTDGSNNSHLYESAEALPAIYRCRHNDKADPKATLAEAKIRNDLAAARLREIAAQQKLEGLVPIEFSRMAIQAFIKHVALRFDELRRRGVVDHAWITACGERFNEIHAIYPFSMA
jgi:hypothetical protein